MSGITIKLTRRILDGHLMYDVEGNLKPIPCGSMVETKIKDYFKGKTGERIPREGFFSELLIVKINLNYTLHITENSMEWNPSLVIYNHQAVR